MKRTVAILLCVLMALSLCACGASGRAMRYIAECWEDIDRVGIDVDEIYFMEYTSRSHLSDEVTEASVYDDIPRKGYAVLFHSYNAEGGGAFMDSYAFFLDDEGDLELCFDYEENELLYERYFERFSPYDLASGEKALEYLTSCNYISGMINYAHDGDPMKGALEKNVWYVLSDKQIEKIVD